MSFTWSKVPTEFKASIVTSLDYPTRCRLKKCSRSDAKLVDTVPMIWDRLFVSISRNSILLRLPNKVTIEYFRKSGKRIEIKFVENPTFFEKIREVIDSQLTHFDVALADFCSLIQNSENTYKEVCFLYSEAIDENDKKLFNRKLFDKLSSLKVTDPTWKIKTEKLYVFLTTTVEEYKTLLGYCCSESLNCITIKEYNFSNEETEELVKTEQWNCAKYLDVQNQNPIQIRNFLHADTLWTITPNLDHKDAWLVIENYLTKNRPHGSTFYIRSIEKLDVPKILEQFDVPLNNEPVTSPWRSECVIHTQRFRIPNSDLMLVVIVMAVELTGKICQVDSIDKDCYNFYTGY